MTEAALSSAHDGATSETCRRWLGIDRVNSSVKCRFALVKGEQESPMPREPQEGKLSAFQHNGRDCRGSLIALPIFLSAHSTSYQSYLRRTIGEGRVGNKESLGNLLFKFKVDG